MNYSKGLRLKIDTQKILPQIEPNYELSGGSFFDFLKLSLDIVHNSTQEELNSFITNPEKARKEFGLELHAHNAILYQRGYPAISSAILNLTSNANITELMYSLRKAESWEEVASLDEMLYDKIFEYLPGSLQKDFSKDTARGFRYYIFLVFFLIYGVYALRDDLFNTLDVTRKNDDRIGYDYLDNGMPILMLPVLPNAVLFDEFSSVNGGGLNEHLRKVKRSYVENGFIEEDLLRTNEHIFLITKFSNIELLQPHIRQAKGKRIMYSFVSILETIVLSMGNDSLDITNEAYQAILEFNKEYEKELQKTDDIKETIDVYNEFSLKHAELSAVIAPQVANFLAKQKKLISNISIDKVLKKVNAADIMSKPEFLVIAGHLEKMKRLGVELLMDTMNYEIAPFDEFNKITERRLLELKERSQLEIEESKDVKRTTKSIVKNRKLFNYRELNKLAKDNGFSKVRQRGDHGIFKKLDGTTIVIPQGRDIGASLSFTIQKDIASASVSA